jgi:hypothetical protein
VLTQALLKTKAEARRVVANWIDGFYNRLRRHSHCGGRSPADDELCTPPQSHWRPRRHEPCPVSGP